MSIRCVRVNRLLTSKIEKIEPTQNASSKNALSASIEKIATATKLTKRETIRVMTSYCPKSVLDFEFWFLF